MKTQELCQLVYTRISHDIASPVGAIYNGTELLADDLSFAEQAGELIQSSAENLMARLQFFRQTFGLPGGSVVADTTQEYLKTFSMPFSLKASCTQTWQRVLVMALTDVFYRGAELTTDENQLTATGSALRDNPDIKAILETGRGTLNAMNAPLWFAYAEAENNNKIYRVKTSDNQIQILVLDKS